MATFAGSNNIAVISQDLIHAAIRGDPQYEKLISVTQQDCHRGGSGNRKENHKRKHRPSAFLGLGQCFQSRLAVSKHSNRMYWPITGATSTSTPTP